MRFCVPAKDIRIHVLVAALDHEDVPYAQTWRLVGEAAAELGLRAPGYHLVRELSCAARHARAARRATRRAALDTALALTSPLATDVLVAARRLEEAKARERLVLDQHKPS